MVLRWLANLLIVDRILREQRRLDAEEETTENELLRVQEDLARAQRELNERLARLARLRRQKRLLSQKGKKMVAESLANMDELDALEEAEQQREAEAQRLREVESRAVADLQAMGAVGVTDWNTVDPNWLASAGSLSGFEVPADPGSSGGIPQSSEGSS